jgi:hypothetical protein
MSSVAIFYRSRNTIRYLHSSDRLRRCLGYQDRAFRSVLQNSTTVLVTTEPALLPPCVQRKRQSWGFSPAIFSPRCHSAKSWHCLIGRSSTSSSRSSRAAAPLCLSAERSLTGHHANMGLPFFDPPLRRLSITVRQKHGLLPTSSRRIAWLRNAASWSAL